MRPRIQLGWSRNRKISYHVLTLHFMTFILILIWEKGKVWRSGSPKFNRRQFFIFVVFQSLNFVMKSDFSWSLKPLTLPRRKTKISDLIHEKDDIYWCTLRHDWVSICIIVIIVYIIYNLNKIVHRYFFILWYFATNI